MDLKFLSRMDALELERDACIFCNTGIGYKEIRRKKSEEWRGSSYTEYKEDVLRIKYMVSDINSYDFTFEFGDDLRELQEKTVETTKKDREIKSIELRRKLEKETSKLNLSDEERKIAIDAVVKDYTKELQQPEIPFIKQFAKKSELEKKIDIMFHNLKLGDLNEICECGIDVKKLENYKDLFNIDEHFYGEVYVSFSPPNLKSHKRCWPFKSFKESTQIKIRYEEFFDRIMQNPIFNGYTNLFDDCPDLLESVLDLDIVINAKNYNPLNYI